MPIKDEDVDTLAIEEGVIADGRLGADAGDFERARARAAHRIPTQLSTSTPRIGMPTDRASTTRLLESTAQRGRAQPMPAEPPQRMSTLRLSWPEAPIESTIPQPRLSADAVAAHACTDDVPCNSKPPHRAACW